MQGCAGFQADWAESIEAAVGVAHGAVYLEVEYRGGYLAALPERVQYGPWRKNSCYTSKAYIWNPSPPA